MHKGLNGRRIPVSGPSIGQREIDYVREAVATAWYEQANVFHARFEEAFARLIGKQFAVALPSCTSAIHLSLLALGIGPGDEVIVPDVTWIASAAPIHYVGATMVFADIDPSTWCISAESLESCITDKTRAVIPVDLYGNMPDMNRIQEIAGRYDLAIIEDAAEAIGSRFKGAPAGSFGRTGVFSFHGSKTVTTGEGGMLVTDAADLHQRVLFLRDHGRAPGDKMFFNTEVAYKYKMSSMQAALGLAQIERLDELIARKRAVFHWYEEALADCPAVRLNAPGPDCFSSYWMVTAIIDPARGLDNAAVMARMDSAGIDCRPFFHPLSSIPALSSLPQAALARARNLNAYRVAPYGINLPSALSLSQDDVTYVAGRLKTLIS